MPITREKKKEVIEKIKGAVSGSSSVVFVNFHGLNVKDSSEMRRVLRTNGVEYFVAKKTITEKALESQKIDGTIPELEGEVALAFSTDAIAPAREIYSFQKKFDGRLSIIGGIFEGSYKDKESMLSIATIPSQNVLYAQFVNLINSPIQGLVMALSAIAEKGAEPQA